MHIRINELGRLYKKLPKEGEFKACHFANNSYEARSIGKMLTELEKAGLLVSRKKDIKGSKLYEHPDKIVRDANNMNLLRYLEYEQKLHSKLTSPKVYTDLREKILQPGSESNDRLARARALHSLNAKNSSNA